MRLSDLFGFKSESKKAAQKRSGISGGALATSWDDERLVDQLLEQNFYIEQLMHDKGMTIECVSFLLDDDEIGQAWSKRKLAAQQKEWSITGDNKEQAAFLTAQLDDWYTRFAGEALDAIMFGLSCPEVIYQQAGGRVGIGRIQQHSTDRFSVTFAGDVIFQALDGEQVNIRRDPIAQKKFFPVVYEPTHDRRAGSPLLIGLLWPWYLRGHLWEFWSRYLERFGSPTWVGKAENAGFVDPATGSSRADEMANMLYQAVNSGVVVVGDNDDVRAESSNGTGGQIFAAADERINERIQKRILGQTLTSGTGSGAGSYAMAKVHDAVRKDIAISDANLIRPAVQGLVSALSQINFPDLPVPVFEFQSDAALNTDRAERDEKLYRIGFRPTKKYLQTAYGLDADDFEIDFSNPASSGESQAFSGANINALQFKSGQNDDPLEKYITDALKQSGDVSDVGALKEIIAGAKDQAGLVDALSDYYEQGKIRSGFSGALEVLLFISDVTGFTQEEDAG